MGDASGYHATLGGALRRLGHDVTVASAGNYWMGTPCDIDVGRRPGRLGGALLWLRLNTSLASRLSGYDVVSLAGCDFLDLRPERIEAIFKKLRSKNGGIFLTDLATSTPFVELCTDSRRQIPYSEWRNPDGTPTGYSKGAAAICQAWKGELAPMCELIYNNVDGVVTALYEYHLSALRVVPPEKLAYGGIPIDIDAIKFEENRFDNSRLRLFMGMHRARALEKGSDHLEWIAKEVIKRDSEHFTFDYVENLPFDVYIRRLRKADIVLDQLYSLTPATNALQAMASGKVVVSGGEEDYYNFIGEKELRPIINSVPGCEGEVVKQLLTFANDRDRLIELSRQGRALVERHNDSMIVARRFLDFWESRL